MKPGDIILTHSSGLVGWAIRAGERIRDPLNTTQWNHAGVIIDRFGATVEALGSGVKFSNVDKHPVRVVIDTGLSDADRLQVVDWAISVVGRPYGYLTIASIALDLLSPAFFHFRSGETLICSQLAAKALEHGGWRCPKIDTSHVMPSDLAKWLLTSPTQKSTGS